MPRRRRDFRGLSESSRFRLLGAIQAAPGRTVKELADHTGLHVNTAREHLQVLEEEGFVVSKAKPTEGRGRPPSEYHPVTDPELNEAAQQRLEAARARGELLRRISPPSDSISHLDEPTLHQLDALYEHLDDAGLQPIVDEEKLEVEIAPCPYYRILGEDQELACTVHAQILRDTLTQIPGSLELEELQAFVEPTTCLVVLQQGRRGDSK